MSRFLLAVCLGSLVLVGGPATLNGQERSDSTQYDTQALRVELHWGDWIVVRGREGAVVGKVGMFRRLDLAAAVAPSQNALLEAREFSSNHYRGNLAIAIGLAAFTVGMGVSSMDVDRSVALPAALVALGGSVVTVQGAFRLNKAYSALARSIWWYNRDLTR